MILAPQPGIERTLPALEGEVLITGPPGKSFPFFRSFIYLFLAVLGFVAVCGLSLVVASRGYSLAMLCELLIAVTCLVIHGF